MHRAYRWYIEQQAIGAFEHHESWPIRLPGYRVIVYNTLINPAHVLDTVAQWQSLVIRSCLQDQAKKEKKRTN